jgi:hypothetical protein
MAGNKVTIAGVEEIEVFVNVTDVDRATTLQILGNDGQV